MDLCLHLAAQVAVTTSVTDPRTDFMINALGTFNLLEAVRAAGINPVLIYASTNKVYGGMEDVAIRKTARRYEYAALKGGVSEERGLDFHSPYGCSKGAADQYVRDYARIYGLRTVTFRQSCIYGYRQFGVEDQGWVAWIARAALTGRPITIYGDGKQVRDVLWVTDLLDAYDRFLRSDLPGAVFNVGGGRAHTLSVIELVHFLEKALGRKVQYRYETWRFADQRVYVSDHTRISKYLGWMPLVDVNQGLNALLQWMQAEGIN
jgi:CDP-paratose 2-epimerase